MHLCCSTQLNTKGLIPGNTPTTGAQRCSTWVCLLPGPLSNRLSISEKWVQLFSRLFTKQPAAGPSMATYAVWELSWSGVGLLVTPTLFHYSLFLLRGWSLTAQHVLMKKKLQSPISRNWKVVVNLLELSTNNFIVCIWKWFVEIKKSVFVFLGPLLSPPSPLHEHRQV